MIPAIDAAKYLLSLSDEDAGDNMSNLKLQKLLYYAQGVHLAIHGKPLFHEQIEAWKHGPVVPPVYHSLKHFGSGPVAIDGAIDFDAIGSDERETMDEVFAVFGQFSAWKLRDMTHSEPPWKETEPGARISRQSLKSYFETLVIEEDGEEA